MGCDKEEMRRREINENEEISVFGECMLKLLNTHLEEGSHDLLCAFDEGIQLLLHFLLASRF